MNRLPATPAGNSMTGTRFPAETTAFPAFLITPRTSTGSLNGPAHVATAGANQT